MTGWDEERYDDLIAELRAQIKALQTTLQEQEKRQKELVAALEEAKQHMLDSEWDAECIAIMEIERAVHVEEKVSNG